MFNGIITHTGIIEKITGNDNLLSLRINCPGLSKNLKKGCSVAVDGVCLTVTAFDDETFDVDIMPETMKRTVAKNYTNGNRLNLETAIKIGDPLNGHFVSGHVDYAGKVLQIQNPGKTKDLVLELPAPFRKYIALKGSVTVNGVSLTVSGIDNDSFTISIIPETLSATNLGLLSEGDRTNIETDLISRYLESLITDRENEITYAFLKERNFI